MDYLIRGSVYLNNNPNFKLIGRDEDLARLSAILMRSSANSVILVGAGGVGVSSILHGLQALKSEPDAPFDIVAKKLFWLDVDGLFSTGDNGELNKQFKKITDRLERTPDSVLMIEDTKDFIDACRNSGCSHFINDLMSTVKNNLNQVIFEARDEDLGIILSAHSDIREHFTLLDIKEPNADSLSAIINKTSENLSRYHGIKIAPDAVAMAIELTTKYRTSDASLSRAQPERSNTLLDRAMASYRLSVHKLVSSEDSNKLRDFYRNQRDGEIAIAESEDEIERLNSEASERNKENNFSLMESQTVVDIRNKIKQYEQIVSENRNNFENLTKKINEGLLLTKELVMHEFSKISGIPSSKLGEDEREKLKSLEKMLKDRIFGQDEAVEKLSNAIKTSRVVKRTKDSPQASFLFIGPSGTGKTEISKAVTEALMGSEKELTRFDMAEYSQKHDVAKLTGSPPGFEGYEAGGILTNLMLKNPNRIILFDECEKADDSIYNVFLSILSDSRLTDNTGRVVSFNDTILIFTSNIGQSHFLDNDLSFEDAKVEAFNELKERYRSEFLNRFAGRQNIVCFNRLGLDNIEKIITREFGKIQSVYQDSDLTIVIDPAVIKIFCTQNYDPVIGARGLPGIITTNLEPKLVNLLLEGFTGSVDVSYSEATKEFDVKGSASV